MSINVIYRWNELSASKTTIFQTKIVISKSSQLVHSFTIEKLPDHLYKVKNFDEFASVNKFLVNRTCITFFQRDVRVYNRKDIL